MFITKKRNTTLVVILVCILLSSCAPVGPDYSPPQIAIPDTFQPVLPEETSRTAIPGSWWELLGDDTLAELIKHAAIANLDIRVAKERLRESRAGRKLARAGFFPSIGAGGTVRTQQQSENSPSTPKFPPGFPQADTKSDLYRVGFDASWEIDIFGGVRRSVEAAEARVDSVESTHNDIIRVVLAEVALNYIELRGLQQRKKVLLKNLRVQKDTFEFTRNLLITGLGTELEVSQARAQLLSTEAELPGLEASIQLRIFQINNLLGEQPGSRNQQLMVYKPLPDIPEAMFTDIPSQVLRRRPDVKAAERSLAAEVADIGIATADLFPRVSLLGGFGGESASMDNLVSNGSGFWSIGPSFNWPLFQGGRIRANIEAQSAQSAAALLIYEKTVLAVLQEVNTALVEHAYERKTSKSLRSAINETRNSVQLSTTLYQEGLSDILTVLNAEALLLSVEEKFVSSQTREWTSLIRLYKALGGGWQEAIPQKG